MKVSAEKNSAPGDLDPINPPADRQTPKRPKHRGKQAPTWYVDPNAADIPLPPEPPPDEPPLGAPGPGAATVDPVTGR
jgi:hypothetical protein